MFRQDRPEDADGRCVLDFEPSAADALQRLTRGRFVFRCGSHPEVHVQHLRSDWTRELADTDDGMQQISAEEVG